LVQFIEREKTNMKSKLLAGAIFLASQIVAQTSILSAAPQKADANPSVSKKTPDSTGDFAKRLSRQATNLLQQVDQANKAVTAKQTQTAIGHINQALADRNQLATLLKAKGQSLVVPLYSELEDQSVLGPVLSARKGKPQPSTSAPITVDDASAQFTFVGLDLDKAESRLDAAKKALENKNPQAASDSLAAIGTDLVVETQEADLPLLAARENLALARTATKNRKYKEASAALKEASIALDTYSKRNATQRTVEVKDLRSKIDSLSQTVAQNHSNAETTIDGWWRQVDSWFTHVAHSL
jgi:hypothetical protein